MEVSDIEENLMEENIENNIFEIIESYWYIFDNKKKFMKQLRFMYKSKSQKTQLLSYLKLNIWNVEDKRPLNYKTINLRHGHRLLIINENTIDGIYPHDEYEDRIKAIL
jgi:hypothetical protein